MRGSAGGAGRGQQGIALVLVLLVVAALSVLVLNLNYTGLVDLRLAENFRDDTRALFLARGAVEAASYWIADDLRKEIRGDAPAYDARCEPDAASCDNDWSLDNPGMEVGDGFVQLRIRDEDGKLWINDTKNLFRSSPGTVLPTMLQRLEQAAGLPPGVLDAVQDWIDPDDAPCGAGGAEADTYESMDPPVRIRNGPILDMTELLRVQGVDPEVYRGGTEDHPYGLRDLFTLFSTGRVNVNTAPPPVLSALADGLDGEAVADHRRDEPFLTRDDFTQYVRDEFPGVALPKAGLWDVSSSYFSAYVTARVGNVVRRVHAVLKRERNRDNVVTSVVYWREE